MLLPQPDAPTSTRNSPGVTSRSSGPTPQRATPPVGVLTPSTAMAPSGRPMAVSAASQTGEDTRAAPSCRCAFWKVGEVGHRVDLLLRLEELGGARAGCRATLPALPSVPSHSGEVSSCRLEVDALVELARGLLGADVELRRRSPSAAARGSSWMSRSACASALRQASTASGCAGAKARGDDAEVERRLARRGQLPAGDQRPCRSSSARRGTGSQVYAASMSPRVHAAWMSCGSQVHHLDARTPSRPPGPARRAGCSARSRRTAWRPSCPAARRRR